MRLVTKRARVSPEPALRGYLSGLDDGPIELQRLERVGKPESQLRKDIAAGVDRDRPFDRLSNRPELIDAVAMVAVRVGDDHAIEPTDLRGKQLLAKSGPQSTRMRSPALSTRMDERRR